MATPQTITKNKKEVFYEGTTNSLIGNTAVHFVFPPLNTYNNGEVVDPYVNRQNDRLVNVDVAFLRLKEFEDPNQDNSHRNGDFFNTNISGAFHALDKDAYHYVYTGNSTPLAAPSLERGASIPTVAEAIDIPSGSNGATFENKTLGMITSNVCRYNDIEVDGLNEGESPTNQRMTAIRLDGASVEDVTLRCLDAAPSTRQTVTNFDSVKSLIDADLINELSNDFVVDITGYTPYTDYVGAVEIVNVERPLDDLRYGEAEDDLPMQFTGASYYFTDAELTSTGGSGVQGKSSVPIDIEVWGGDCFIGLHTFKVSDSTYSLTDGEKDVDGTGVFGNPSTQTSKWDYYFKKTSGTVNNEDVSRPFPLKGVSQTVTVLLESEINPEFIDKPEHNSYSYDSTAAVGSSNLPIPVADEAGQIRSKFKYYLNLDYVKENTYKIFFPYQSFDINNNEFGARVSYSDQKVYNTDIEGFDRYRVASFYDMDESNGSISKLIEVGDRVFAIQESAFSYLPITAQIIETQDGSNLSVRNGEIIGTPNKINTLYGTRHPATVKVDGTTAFFVDQVRGEFCMFDGQSVNLVSRVGMESYFSGKLDGAGLNDLTSIYDNKKKEYFLFFREDEGVVYSSTRGVWVSRLLESSDINTLGGTRIGDKFLLAGFTDIATFGVGELYNTDAIVGDWWGVTSPPASATIVVNSEPDAVKTFDGITVVSDNIIQPVNFTVIKSDDTSSVADLTSAVVNDKEGTFRLKNLRDASGARSRGVYGEFKFYLNPTSLTGSGIKQNGTTSVLTKYRTSKRPI